MLNLSLRRALAPSALCGVFGGRALHATAFRSADATAGDFERVLSKHAEMRESYDELTTSFAPHALPTDGGEVDMMQVIRKRLIYRAKQRGWLEVDLLMGKFAVENVPAMSGEELRQFENILAAETIDIYNYVSGKDAVPEELQCAMMTRLQEYAASAPLGRASPEGYAQVKTVMSN